MPQDFLFALPSSPLPRWRRRSALPRRCRLNRRERRCNWPRRPAPCRLHGPALANAYCAGCHGADGNSTNPQYPKLAGQKEFYLRAELRAFKSGARKSDLMSGPASMLTDAQIVELARFYSRQAERPDVVADVALAQAGESVFNEPRRGSPACAACHSPAGYGRRGSMGRGGTMMGRGGMMGPMGMGHRGMIDSNLNGPNLNGQHAAYTVQQLDAFARGARSGTVMGPIAAALSAKERGAVAAYLAGLR